MRQVTISTLASILALACYKIYAQQQTTTTDEQPRLDEKYQNPEAHVSEPLPSHQKFPLTCSDEYTKRLQDFEKDENSGHICTPKSNCGRFSTDGLKNNILTEDEVKVLKSMAKLGTSIVGGGQGGASIIEMHTSTASYKNQFVSLFNRMEQGDQQTIERMKVLYSKENLKVYTSAKNKVKQLIAETFDVQADRLHLAAPSFFSKLENKPAISMNDEYWHSHVDSLQYQSFCYTSLIYLSDYGLDFTGGRFIFEGKSGQEKFGSEKAHIVEPKSGTISMFTSGHENKHRVEAVKSGERFAFTMGFTCDEQFRIEDPSLPEKWYEVENEPNKDEL